VDEMNLLNTKFFCGFLVTHLGFLISDGLWPKVHRRFAGKPFAIGCMQDTKNVVWLLLLTLETSRIFHVSRVRYPHILWKLNPQVYSCNKTSLPNSIHICRHLGEWRPKI